MENKKTIEKITKSKSFLFGEKKKERDKSLARVTIKIIEKIQINNCKSQKKAISS